WISGPLGQPLVVGDAAAAVFHVAAELDGHSIVGMAAVPDGNGQSNGLEVQKGQGRPEGAERRGEAGLDDQVPGLNGPALPVLDGPEREALGEIVDRRISLLLEQ